MSLDTLKNKIGFGARANKYTVVIPYGDADDVDALAKGASLPDLTIGAVEVWNKGRKLVVAGDAVYAGTWDLTFYNTEDLKLKKIFEDELINLDDFENNARGYASNSEYMKDITVSQLDAQNAVTATYTLHNAFPTVITAVDYDGTSQDTITEFTVTFAYSHWTREV